MTFLNRSARRPRQIVPPGMRRGRPGHRAVMTTREKVAGAGPESMSFGELEIGFDARVLRPRPWTQGQSVWARELLAVAPPGPVLELCAGAGQIGLLAVHSSDRRLVCVDASEVACEFARANADRAGMAERVEVRLGRMEDVLGDDERFALVIADPPWVPSAEIGRFPEDPVTAIDGGAEGLDLARICVEVARAHVATGGAVLLQLGAVDQVQALGLEATEVVEVRSFERGVVALLALR